MLINGGIVMNYQNDVIWKQVQEYLPLENRLSNKNIPKEYFISIQNVKIHIDHYQKVTPKARVVLFHGVGGNGRLLSFIAVRLLKNGYDVVCPDMPLYGYTDYKGAVTYDMWVSYGAAIVQHFQKDGLPVFLFGLSAGGMLAYQIANECSNISGIMATCILDQRDPYVTKHTAVNPIIAVVGNVLISMLTRIGGSFRVPMKIVANMKNITNNRKLAALLMKDKKSSGVKVPLTFIHSMVNPVIKTEPEDFTSCPFLLVHPGNDCWTDIELSKMFYNRLACKKSLKILEGAGHFPIEDIGLKQLEKYCVDFLDSHS